MMLQQQQQQQQLLLPSTTQNSPFTTNDNSSSTADHHHHHTPIMIEYGSDDDDNDDNQPINNNNNGGVIHWLQNSHSFYHFNQSSSSLSSSSHNNHGSSHPYSNDSNHFQSIQWQKLTNFSTVQWQYRSKLIQVYMHLTLTIVSALVGYLFHIMVLSPVFFSSDGSDGGSGGFPTLLLLVSMIALVMYLKWTSTTNNHNNNNNNSYMNNGDITVSDENDDDDDLMNNNSNSNSNSSSKTSVIELSSFLGTRNFALYAFGFINGLHISPLVQQISENIDASLPLVALLSTTMIFVCFTGFAMFSRRRSHLYLGSALTSSLSILFIMVLLGGSSMMSQFVSLYGGLLVFIGFVVFDTQMIIEKLHSGYTDTVNLALELFIDFVAIFVRILIILAKKSSRRDQ